MVLVMYNELPVSGYALELKRGLEEAYQHLWERFTTTHEHRKKHYDKGHMDDPLKREKHGMSKKLHP